MLKTIMKWIGTGGEELTLGSGSAGTAIKSCKITQCVNDGEDLTPGSCCAAVAEIVVITSNALSITGGTKFSLFKEDDAGVQHQIGIFTAEKPTRTSANSYKITAYDNMIKLDRDFSRDRNLMALMWAIRDGTAQFNLAGLANYICLGCELGKIVTEDFPNAQMIVPPFDLAGCTGRKIMRWISECAGCFCRADSNGAIRLQQFSGDPVVTIRPTGSRYYFSGSLSYEDFSVPAVDGVGYWVDGAYYEFVDPGLGHAPENPFVIGEDNRLWKASVDPDGNTAALYNQLVAVGAYRPCKVSIPACLDIHAGDVVSIVTPSNENLRMLVMTKVTSGQRDTLECTGSISRGSSSAVCGIGTGSSPNLSEQDILDRLGAAWRDINGVITLVKKEDIPK